LLPARLDDPSRSGGYQLARGQSAD